MGGMLPSDIEHINPNVWQATQQQRELGQAVVAVSRDLAQVEDALGALRVLCEHQVYSSGKMYTGNRIAFGRGEFAEVEEYFRCAVCGEQWTTVRYQVNLRGLL